MKKTLFVLLVTALSGSYGFSQSKVAIKPIKSVNSNLQNQSKGINGIPTGAPNWGANNFDLGTNDINDCEAVNVPYHQTFETAVVPGMPECTTIENAGQGNNWETYNGTNGDFTGTYLRYKWNSSYDANAWFYTQGINLEAGNTYKVSYEYGSAVGALYAENLAVAYGTEPTHTAMTNSIATHEGILSSYAKLTNEVEITPTETGVYYFGFQSFSEADMFYLVMDNIKVEAVDGEGGGEEPTYCEPMLDCTDNDMITNVTFQEINNDSECGENGYTNYTSMVANVVAGESYPINVTVGDGWSNESVSVWIDYNNNGTFEQNEFSYVGTGSNSVVEGNISIPSDVAEGNYRMRVRVAAVGAGAATWDMACDEEQGYGETEDYTVSISTPEPIVYCEPMLDCTDNDMITNVTFQEINNDSECGENGYTNYTSMIANVVAGETYPIYVTVGDGWSNESVSVWIDYNNNGTFEQNEFSYVGTGSDSVVEGNISIPSDVAEGNYRMRVRVAAVGAGAATWDMACDEEQGYGETEDYTVSISTEVEEEPVYCEPELNCTDGDLITNVTFQEINNPTACSPNGYGNYTSMVATVVAGETYPITVAVGSGFTYESVSVWVDYNNNGTFEQNEFTYVGTGSGSDVVGELEIPTDVAVGSYRMRVRVAAVNYGTATWDMACDESQVYGETEDYTLQVEEMLASPSNMSTDFAVYPNPVQDVLTIASQNEVKSVEIFNTIGQKVMTANKVSNGKINVQSLTAGTYVFRAVLENGAVETFKVIKK